jgi:hypothetical protein
MTREEFKLFELFHPHAAQKLEEVKGKKRFVHYTSARAAKSIIESACIWMRNVTCMNDYSEVQHGLECLFAAYNSDIGKKFRDALDIWFPGLCKEVEELFNGWLPEMRYGTYIVCVSEHEDKENMLGRLSMWRAYGRTTGVALVFNSDPFFNESNALNAFSSPVAYKSAEEYQHDFKNMIERLLEHASLLRHLGGDALKERLFATFMLTGVCTKHPGYLEEKEWRVIHLPKIYESKHLIKSLEVIGEGPEIVYKIPLKNIPGEGLRGIEVPELLHSIIIGPTDYPLATRDAFVEMLTSAGVQNAGQKVLVSEIPLRR